MKGGFVLLTLFLAVAISGALHYNKNKDTPDEAERINKALSGASSILSNGSRLSLITLPANHEVISLTRFELAPIALTDNADTVLYISLPDSAIEIPAGKTMHWQHRDDKYMYTITSSHNAK